MTQLVLVGVTKSKSSRLHKTEVTGSSGELLKTSYSSRKEGTGVFP